VIVRWIFALVLFLLVSGTAAAEGGKFIAAPSASSGGMGRYRVILAPSVDADAVIPQLLAICRCRTEFFAEAGVAGVMINATPSAARLLSSDRRVALVQEMPSGTEAFDVGGDATEGERQPQVAPGSVVAVDQPVVESRVPVQPSSAPITANTVDAPWKLGPYTYDGSGNIASIGDDQYSYDAYGRLTAASVRGSSQEYAYDRYANQTSRTTGGTTTTFGVDTATNRSTIAGVQYDGAGRVTQTPIASFSYDAADMIVESNISGGRSVHLYSASDERIGSIGVSSTNVPTGWSDWTIRDLGGKVLRRYRKKPSGWTWEQDYIYRDGQLIASEIASSSRTRQYHADHLGTPRLVTDDHGMKVSSHDYYPFGEEITPPTPERLQFTAHERDHPSLDYMHARYYSPTIGRFLSVDPTWESADLGKPQTWNRYTYVVNNPVNLTDPDGRNPFFGQVLKELAVDFLTDGSSTGSADLPKDPAERARYMEQNNKDPRRRPATLSPGPHADESIPARNSQPKFTPEERAKMNEIGRKSGCHTCGSPDPKTKSGNFVLDHQPSSAINPPGQPQKLYPHCIECSRRQGGEVRQFLRDLLEKAKKLL
jgi:RHS repeat-associated protein